VYLCGSIMISIAVPPLIAIAHATGAPLQFAVSKRRRIDRAI
jgi:hypothetical protein